MRTTTASSTCRTRSGSSNSSSSAGTRFRLPAAFPLSTPRRTTSAADRHESQAVRRAALGPGLLALLLVGASPAAAQEPAPPPRPDLPLIGGTLELGLGHLCDDTGCVRHLQRSLESFDGL